MFNVYGVERTAENTDFQKPPRSFFVLFSIILYIFLFFKFKMQKIRQKS
jgi:hypothetical protein